MILLQGTISPVSTLLNIIISKYLFSSYCVSVISQTPLELNLYNSYMFYYSNNIETLVNLLLNASEMGCSDYIVRVKKPKNFMKAYEKAVYLGNARRSNRKIIMLPTSTTFYENNQDLLHVLSMKETSFVANILLVIPEKTVYHCEIYNLITNKFVGIKDNKPVFLDRWNSCSNKFEKDVHLFPYENMSNLEGKIVKVTGFTYKPYVVLDLDTNAVPLGRDGTDIRIVHEFCRWINCTIELISDNGFEWGAAYQNLTGTGVLGNIVEDKADIGITALFSWYDDYIVMDFSTPTTRTAVTCITPSPRLLVSWEMPLWPFSLYMWIGLLLTFVYASTALIIAKGFSTEDVFLSTFGIMITQSQPESVFSSWRIRSVIGWMMVAALVLSNAYGGGLAATFTVPNYEKSIDTIQDMVDRQMEWGGTHDAWIFSLRFMHEPLFEQLRSLFQSYSFEELQRKSYTRKLAYAIEKLPAGYFAIGDYLTREVSKDFMIMLEEFYHEYSVVMLRKSSPYTNKLNDLIGRLQQSGLLLAWETQVALRHMDYKVLLEIRLSRSKRDVSVIEPLSFRHVVGIFIVLGIGVSISFLIFVFEILVDRRKIIE